MNPSLRGPKRNGAQSGTQVWWVASRDVPIRHSHDNKIAQNAGWDRELLATELPELAEILIVENLDISITGFDRLDNSPRSALAFNSAASPGRRAGGRAGGSLRRGASSGGEGFIMRPSGRVHAQGHLGRGPWVNAASGIAAQKQHLSIQHADKRAVATSGV
jgi:hypothetical protein